MSGLKKLFSFSILGAMLALLIAACGGGGGGSGGSSAASFTVVGTQMGGARQGTSLPVATASGTVSTLFKFASSVDWPVYSTTDGTNLYVTDCGYSHTDFEIIKISLATGNASILAGSAVQGAADGTGTAATFNCPVGITTDGINLYVSDQSNDTIRRIAPVSGVALADMTSANAVVTTLAGQSGVFGAADGTGAAAQFGGPNGITTDGKALYVADYYNNKIRKIAPSSGTLADMTAASAVVTSLTGTANVKMGPGHADGPVASATFLYPADITTDGTAFYVADASNNEIRMIANGQVSTLAGSAVLAHGAQDGVGTAATLWYPWGITTDGTHLYVTDANNKVRMITPASGATLDTMTAASAVVSSLTGTPNTSMASGVTDGAAANARFNNLNGITTDGKSLYMVDSDNGLVRKLQ